LLAWEDIQEEAAELKLEDLQRKQLAENQAKSKRDLRESVWRTYKTVMLLAKDNSIRSIDLGLVHSSADASLVGFIVHRLTQDGDISEGISPKFLVRNWSGAHKEWSTKAVKDAVFASPLFPRLLNGDLIRDTIARGVSNSVLAYVGKTASGGYDPFVFGVSMSPQEVEISEDVYVITAETAEAYKQSLSAPPKPWGPGTSSTPTAASRPRLRLAAPPAPKPQSPVKGERGVQLPSRTRYCSASVVWRSAGSEMDELLHQGAVAVRHHQEPAVDGGRRGCARRWRIQTVRRRNEDRAAGTGIEGHRPVAATRRHRPEWRCARQHIGLPFFQAKGGAY
jgi:hypothetical protein